VGPVALVCAAPALAQPVAPPPAPASPASEVDPAALAMAREIIRIGFPEDKRVGMFIGTVNTLTSQIRTATMARLNNDPGAKAIVDAKLDKFLGSAHDVLVAHIPDFMDAYGHAYAREFSMAELGELLAFVKTPAGAHFFQRSSALISDPRFATANAAYLRDLQPLSDKMRDELIAELTDYFVKHPPKPTGSS
jgi:hypothetical protein